MHEVLTHPSWYLAAGVILVLMALGASVLRRLPISTAIVYLLVGGLLGPVGLGMLVVDPVQNAPALELISEVAVIVSLFTAGLKLRVSLRDRLWHLPVRLASVSMVLTVAGVSLVGVLGLGLPLGAAVLLGAILAPTDPVLASDVQTSDAFDRDHVRFTLTGEAGLNDGTAFPFVMLGLGLLGLHELGDNGLRWLAVDLVWAVAGGLAIGGILGAGVARLVVYLRINHRAAHGVDELLLLGLIALAYGAAVTLATYGFLAVFAAGLAVRQVERVVVGEEPEEELRSPVVEPDGDIDTTAEGAAASVAHSLLTFNEALERILEVVVVLIVASALTALGVPVAVAWLAPLLFLVIRPISVVIGLAGAALPRSALGLIAWFGIRGIGSVYYLSYAATHGLDPELTSTLAGLVFAIIALSILVHGISVTPLMGWYQRRVARREQRVGRAGA